MSIMKGHCAGRGRGMLAIFTLIKVTYSLSSCLASSASRRRDKRRYAFAASGDAVGASCRGGNMRCPGTFSGFSNSTVRCSDSAARA